MSLPFFRVIHGKLVIVDYEPDGDSVRFIADRPDLFQTIHRAYRINRSQKDGSLQLRFEAVDAPELHYGGAAQPLGGEARDQLLGWLGFTNIRYKPNNPTQVESAKPTSVRGAILTKGADPHGRPISYVLLEKDLGAKDGDNILVDADILSRTMNLKLLQTGAAYPLFYSTTPHDHQQKLRDVTAKAKDKELGLWKLDSTKDFILEGPDSIGPKGQLIFPKLFRRSTDYFKAVDRGFSGDLAEWLIWTETNKQTSENDQVVTHVTSSSPIEVKLSDLLRQRNRHILFQGDLLDIMFVEK